MGRGGAAGGVPTCPTISLVDGVLSACGRANGLAYSPDGRLIAMATARTAGLLIDGFVILQFIIALAEWVGGGLATWGSLVARPTPGSLPPPVQDSPDDEDVPSPPPPMPPAA